MDCRGQSVVDRAVKRLSEDIYCASIPPEVLVAVRAASEDLDADASVGELLALTYSLLADSEPDYASDFSCRVFAHLGKDHWISIALLITDLRAMNLDYEDWIEAFLDTTRECSSASRVHMHILADQAGQRGDCFLELLFCLAANSHTPGSVCPARFDRLYRDYDLVELLPSSPLTEEEWRPRPLLSFNYDSIKLREGLKYADSESDRFQFNNAYHQSLVDFFVARFFDTSIRNEKTAVFNRFSNDLIPEWRIPLGNIALGNCSGNDPLKSLKMKLREGYCFPVVHPIVLDHLGDVAESAEHRLMTYVFRSSSFLLSCRSVDRGLAWERAFAYGNLPNGVRLLKSWRASHL